MQKLICTFVVIADPEDERVLCTPYCYRMQKLICTAIHVCSYTADPEDERDLALLTTARMQKLIYTTL